MNNPTLPLMPGETQISALWPEHKAALKGRGLSDDTIRLARLRSVRSEEGAAIVGRRNDGSYAGICIPYTLPGQNRIRGERLRRDNPPMEARSNGQLHPKGKYLSPPQRCPQLYFAPGTDPALLTDTNTPLVITEGELKAMALSQVSRERMTEGKPPFLACGLAGIYSFTGTIGKTDGPKGERIDVKGPIPDLDLLNWIGRKVTLLYDTNVATNPLVKHARSKLAREVESRGAIPYYADLPAEPGVNGCDDYLAKRGAKALLAIINSARRVDPVVPDGFKITSNGVYAVGHDKDNQEGLEFVCSRLEVLAATRDDHSKNWGRWLRFHDPDGKEKLIAISMSLFAGDGTGLREILLSEGLNMGSGRRTRERLSEYIMRCIPEDRARCVNRLGFVGESSVFVLPDTTIGQTDGETILFQTATTIDHKLNVKGTADDWRENIGRHCVGNSRLVFAASASFGAPLLHLANESGGGFHIRGSSSIGKTTILRVAGSAVGGGGKDGYISTWRTTANGLEGVAASHNHLLLALDELSQCSPAEIADAVYMLCNGQGKARMSRTINLRKTTEWQTLFLSTGETGLADVLAQAGRKLRGGLEVRLVEIEADAGKGLGVFERIPPEFASAETFAVYLSSTSLKYYGTPFRNYLENLTRNYNEVAEVLRRTRNRFLQAYVGGDASGEVSRVAGRFALVGAAGEMATDLNLTGWPGGEAIQTAGTLFQAWLATRGTQKAGDEDAAIRQVRRFIEAHGASRFQSTTAGRHPEKVIDRAGFRDDEESPVVFYILPETFRTEICKGYDYRMVARTLIERGFSPAAALQKQKSPSDKHTGIQRTFPDVGRVRVIEVTSAILED